MVAGHRCDITEGQGRETEKVHSEELSQLNSKHWPFYINAKL